MERPPGVGPPQQEDHGESFAPLVGGEADEHRLQRLLHPLGSFEPRSLTKLPAEPTAQLGQQQICMLAGITELGRSPGDQPVRTPVIGLEEKLPIDSIVQRGKKLLPVAKVHIDRPGRHADPTGQPLDGQIALATRQLRHEPVHDALACGRLLGRPLPRPVWISRCRAHAMSVTPPDMEQASALAPRATWRRRLALVLAVVAPGAALSPAAATSSPTVELSAAPSESFWRGEVPEGTVADPAFCTHHSCEIVDIVVPRAAPRLVVAIDTSEVENTFDFLYDIRLYLYSPDGDLRARDTASFESTVVVTEDVEAGRWRAVISPDAVHGTLPYRGYAALTEPLEPPAPTTAGDLLPNLVAQVPTNLRLETPPLNGPPPVVWDFRGQAHGPSSCYPQEAIDFGARRCLRFDQTVANLGAGPLELRADEGDGPMTQRIHRADGSVREQRVGQVRFHVQHLHFHYEAYAQVRLYTVRSDGSPGALVREGRKQGFCLADTRNMRFGRPEQQPARYTDPETCDGRDEAPVHSRVGLTPGWADTYPWYIPEQFIEISDVADGRYLLEFTVNETGALEETTRADNVARVLFDLAGDDVEIVAACTPSRTHACDRIA